MALLTHIQVTLDTAAPDEAAADELCDLFYSEDGDPTEGYASQNTSLFVDQTSLQATHYASGIELNLQQTPADLRHAGVTGCVVWNGAVVLSAAFERWTAEGLVSLAGQHVLELGSGSGMLAAAMALLGAHVVATDQEERLSLLQRNVATNCTEVLGSGNSSSKAYGFSPKGGTVKVRELDWEYASTFEDDGVDPATGWDLVVAADVIYCEAVAMIFVEALKAVCECGQVPAIVCVELRTQEVHLAFVEALLSVGWRVHRLPERALSEEARTKRVVVYLVECEQTDEP